MANLLDNNVTAFAIGPSGALTLVLPVLPGNPNPVSTGANSAPSGITVSPNGQFVYVTNSASNTVTAFRIEGTGLLTLVPATAPATNPVSTGAGTAPTGIAVSPNGQFVYVANSGADTVTAFSIGGTGLLTQVAPAVPPAVPAPNPVSTGPNSAPSGITVSPNGQFVYVANSGADTVTAFSIGGTGLLTQVPAATNPVSTGPNTAPSGITVSPNGQFVYVTNRTSGTVTAFSIGGDGSLTQVVPPAPPAKNPVSSGGATPTGIKISPNGQFVYVANSGADTVTAFSIGGNGLLTQVAAAAPATNPVSTGGTTPRGIGVLGQP